MSEKKEADSGKSPKPDQRLAERPNHLDKAAANQQTQPADDAGYCMWDEV